MPSLPLSHPYPVEVGAPERDEQQDNGGGVVEQDEAGQRGHRVRLQRSTEGGGVGWGILYFFRGVILGI